MKNSEFRSENVEVAPDKSHYAQGGIEPWQFIVAHDLNFFEGSIVKYITRWRYKNGVEDLRKVIVYADELLRQAESGGIVRAGGTLAARPTAAKYATANDMGHSERAVVDYVFAWRNTGSPLALYAIKEHARRAIQLAE